MGKRRFLCLVCHRSFSKKKRIARNFSDFVKFHDFIVNKINKVALSEKTFLSRKTIWRLFKPFFQYLPISSDSLFLLDKNNNIPLNISWVLGIDGKWLHRQGVIMIYRNVTHKVNLYWSFHQSESYFAIENDFNRLTSIIKNNLPKGLITDWKGAIVSATNIFLPPIAHQRCLSHVQRQLMILLPLRSPISATRDLRVIAKVITRINCYEEKYVWESRVDNWILKHRYLLKEKTIGVNTKKKWWYTHGNLRRAIKLLKFETKYLFAYLDYPFLPKTNNSLEGLNSQIKGKLSNHRGMKTHQQVIFIFWLLTFKRVKSRKDLKLLWDNLKTKIFRY